MDTETETLVSVLRDRMTKMTDDERHELMHELMDGWCVHCGAETPCYCWNDE